MVSPLATLTTRIWGTRTTLLIGVFFETLSFVAASFSSQIWHLFLTQGICFGWGAGFLFVGSVGVPSQWFLKRRSLANGLGSAGSGIGGLVYSLAAQSMLTSVGLPWAFRILGIVSFTVNFACAMLLKDRNKHVGSNVVTFNTELLKRYEFWLLLGFGWFSMLAYVMLLYSIPSYARAIGTTAKQGSIAGALLNLGQGIGRPLVGYFSDHFGRINMAGVTTFMAGILVLVLWVNAKSFGVSKRFSCLGMKRL
jgi:MFS family permease